MIQFIIYFFAIVGVCSIFYHFVDIFIYSSFFWERVKKAVGFEERKKDINISVELKSNEMELKNTINRAMGELNRIPKFRNPSLPLMTKEVNLQDQYHGDFEANTHTTSE